MLCVKLWPMKVVDKGGRLLGQNVIWKRESSIILPFIAHLAENIRTRLHATMLLRSSVANEHQDLTKTGESCFVVAHFHSVLEGTLKLLQFSLFQIQMNLVMKTVILILAMNDPNQVLLKQIPALFTDGSSIALTVNRRMGDTEKITIVGTTLGTSDAARTYRT
jgi:hypothetical protein